MADLQKKCERGKSGGVKRKRATSPHPETKITVAKPKGKTKQSKGGLPESKVPVNKGALAESKLTGVKRPRAESKVAVAKPKSKPNVPAAALDSHVQDPTVYVDSDLKLYRWKNNQKVLLGITFSHSRPYSHLLPPLSPTTGTKPLESTEAATKQKKSVKKIKK